MNQKMNLGVDSQKQASMKTLLFLLIAAFLSVALVLVWGAFTRPVAPAKAPSESKQSRNNNPLQKEFVAIGKKHGIDFSFSADTKYFFDWQSFPSALFCRQPGSLDVLLIGDSTLAWGMVPQVIEQITGLKVGMMALRSLYLNVRTVRTMKLLQKIYLKSGGITILGFDHFTQTKPAQMLHYPDDDFGKLDRASGDALVTFINSRFRLCHGKDPVWPVQILAEFSGDKKSQESKILSYFTNDSLARYQKNINQMRAYIGSQWHIALPEETWVHRSFAAWLHPEWFIQKQLEEKKGPSVAESDIYKLAADGEPGDIQRWALVKWDYRSTTLFQRFEPAHSIYSDSPGYALFTPEKHHPPNAAAARSLTGRVAYLITYYDSDAKYQLARTYYHHFYKDRFALIDLGKMHPVADSYPLDKVNHTINVTGIYKSIQIGQWLKAHLGEPKR